MKTTQPCKAVSVALVAGYFSMAVFSNLFDYRFDIYQFTGRPSGQGSDGKQ